MIVKPGSLACLEVYIKEAGLTCMAYRSFFASELRSPTESSRCVGISAMTFLDAPLVAVVVDPSSTGALLAREVHQRGPLRG